ncbi:SLC13 family permease [Frigidibacter mobilis]|uniref:Citrate transporter n=1 Tax=Frigidibacter mobilis TaxID=1335048 RepID=A0A159Z3J6_9RHOB|nr:citrate transporter [Frigidibacter mobilis]
MTLPQILILLILVATLGLFLWGRFRHDVVALAALMACVLAGLVEPEAAFAGFGHPAVITVACILVLSQGLQNTGAVDWLARSVLPRDAGRTVSLAALMGLGAALSGFMNNVGAMALLMPIAVQLSGRIGLTPGQALMPLAFGTILGGMTTLVGTPPNLIVSGFRQQAGGAPFRMFDFAPVGLAVAVLGVAFVAVIGWRLVPARKPAGGEGFDTGSYLTEVRIPGKSKAVGLTLRAFEREIEASGAQIVTIVRNEVRMTAPHGGRIIREDDVLMLLADVGALAEALSVFGIKLEEQKTAAESAAKKQAGAADDLLADAAAGGAAGAGEATVGAEPDAEEAKPAPERDEEIVLRELAVLPGASIVGRSASDLKLRTRFGLNLLAVSRPHQPPRARLRELKLQSGDLLMMQGPAEVMSDFINESGCVPLGERELRIPDKRMAIIAGAIMLVAVLVVTLGLLPAAAAFALGMLATMLAKTVPLRQIYTAIDWPVVVLLAALIPVAGAMQSTGAADLLSRFLVETIAQGNAIAALAVVLVVTMFLSDVMNNAATAAVLCPVALGIAGALGVNPDSFLMAVAIGSSCAFLTPIGHQNNTLILGPGGFRFGDYWRLGMPLELLVVVVSLPLLLLVWPL